MQMSFGHRQGTWARLFAARKK